MKTDREYRKLASQNRALRTHLSILERQTLKLSNQLTRSQELLTKIEMRVDLAQVFPDKKEAGE